MVAATLPGIRRVEHVMGMPIVDRRARRGRRWRSPGRRVRRVPRGRRALQHLSRRQRDHAHQPRRARARRRASRRARDPRALRASCAPRRGGFFDVRAASAVDDRPVRARQGLVRRPRRRDPRRRGRARLRGQRRRRRPRARARRCRTTAGASGSSTRRSATRSPRSSSRNDLAIATSGAYARGDHVLDPHTRRPPRASSRSRSPGPISRPPTRTRRRRSRWARRARPGQRGSAATRR